MKPGLAASANVENLDPHFIRKEDRDLTWNSLSLGKSVVWFLLAFTLKRDGGLAVLLLAICQRAFPGNVGNEGLFRKSALHTTV